nr:flavone 6-hydroxylase [Tanacetum cinerariifolium]
MRKRYVVKITDSFEDIIRMLEKDLKLSPGCYKLAYKPANKKVRKFGSRQIVIGTLRFWMPRLLLMMIFMLRILMKMILLRGIMLRMILTMSLVTRTRWSTLQRK